MSPGLGLLGEISSPARVAALGLPQCPYCSLIQTPEKRPETCTSKPRFFGQSSCSGSKLLLGKFCKALPGAWLLLVLAKVFSEGVLGCIFLETWSNMGMKTRCLKEGSDKCKKEQ